LPADASFCLECGQSVGAPPAPRHVSPEAYTPKHLAEKILTSKSALEGERKQVTVLFADIKGSMELLADRDPEDARKLLDPVLQHMMEAVHHYEGTVNQVMGDGLMALFGAPLAHEDHAVRACYAALRMQESVKQYAEEVFRTHGVPVRIRVGLNSGEVVVRSIGSDLHMDYTAIGQTTHLAARMEQLAAPGSVLLAPATLQLAEGYVQVTSRGPVAIKGLPAPVEVFELTGASAVRSRLQASAARGFTRFIGRDAEMEQLRRALKQASEGQGQVVAVVGEPGLGKSRLFYELMHSHHTQDWRILESGSVSYGKATSYLPVIDLLKTYFKIIARDSHRDIQAKVTGAVLTLDRALEPTVAPMLTLLDVPTDDTQWTTLDPQQRRQRTLDAVKRLLLRESQMQPLLVVFEDLHWIDPESQALLEGLVESLPAARLLLLVNYRPEYRHGWASKTYYTQLRLDAFPAETASELLEALVGRDPTVDSLKVLLAAHTGGNPLFLEESVRSLVEQGALAGERSAYRLTRAVEALQVPATVQVILAARIDRLPPEGKDLLQAAAVVGKNVRFTLLRAIAEEPEDALRARLAWLQTAEFLYETSLFPDLEYTFKHALTHEVAYGSLLQERRKSLHARVLAAVEQLYPDRLDEQVEVLAHHALRAEEWERAARWCRAAGLKARSRSAYREGRVWLEEAIRALRYLPESRQNQELGVDIRLELRPVYGALAWADEGLTSLQEAEEIAQQLGDEGRLRNVYAVTMSWFRGRGEYDRALECGQRAQSLARDSGDLGFEAYIAFHQARLHRELGELEQAVERFRTAITILTSHPGVGSQGPLGISVGDCRSVLAWTLADLGRFDEAIAEGDKGVRETDHAMGLFLVAVASNILGLVHLLRGDVTAATPWLERGVQIASEQQVADPLAWGNAILGATELLRGESGSAVEHLDEAHQIAVTNSLQGGYALWTIWRGEAYLAVSRRKDARQSMMDALTFAREHRERGFEAEALRALGHLATTAEPPDVDEADARYHEALTQAEELGLRPLQAHCHLGLGKLYRAVGRAEEARAELSVAAEMLREMGMSYWLPDAEAELAQATAALAGQPAS